MLGRTFIALQALILISLPVSAKNLTLDDYVKKLESHPQVMQILSKSNQYYESSLGIMGLPNPSIILGIDNVPVQSQSFDEFLPTSKMIGFSQQLPSYSLRKANSSKQRQMSKKQKLIAKFTKNRLSAMLVSAISRLEKVKKQQQYLNKQINHYKELETYFKGKLESGASVYWRFSQVDVERALVEQKVNNINAERDEIEAELIRLVGEVPNIQITNIFNNPWKNPEDLYPVKIAQEDVSIAKFGVDAAKSAYYPSYGINAIYKQREDGSTFSGEDWVSIKANISIPLWYKWNQAPKKRAAIASKHSAIKFYDDTKLSWVKKLTSLESKRDATLENILVLKNKDTALKSMINATKRTYESGETSLQTLLDAKINRLSIQSQLEDQRFKHIALSSEINSYIVGE